MIAGHDKRLGRQHGQVLLALYTPVSGDTGNNTLTDELTGDRRGPSGHSKVSPFNTLP